MKNQKTALILGRIFIAFCMLALSSVSLMAMLNPQSVMDLVQVKLTNTDAMSSIRGVYGGVGFTIIIALLYLLINDVKKGVVLLTMFWGFYALSRFITQINEGALGDFGSNWMKIETIFCILGCLLVMMIKPQPKTA